MKIGITGATGQLGRLVVKYLKEKVSADQIVALARTLEKASDLGVEVRKFDYNKPEVMSEALKGVDKLLLISASEIGARVRQHANVIEAAKNAGVSYIAYTSLLRADKSSLSLADEHLETEKLIKNSGIPFTILRNGWYTENYTGSISDVIDHEVLLGSSGEGKISSATRADYALAAATVVTREGLDGKTFELAGDEFFTLSDMAAEISRQTGKNIVYKNLPADEYAQALIKAGTPEGYAQFFAGTHISTEKGDLFDDGHHLSQLTGKPTTTLSQAIKQALTHIQQYH